MKCYPHPYPANIPILYRNIMDGLPSDFARDVFLWGVERRGEDAFCYRSEKRAIEADYVLGAIKFLLDMQHRVIGQMGGLLMSEEQRADLEHYFMVRWSNWRYGGNASLPLSMMEVWE